MVRRSLALLFAVSALVATPTARAADSDEDSATKSDAAPPGEPAEQHSKRLRPPVLLPTAERPPAEPVNVFISPPFADFEHRLDDLLRLIAEFQAKVAEGSVLVLQAEHGVPLDELPAREQLEDRRYGRNHLLIWVRESTEPAAPPTENGEQGEEDYS